MAHSFGYDFPNRNKTHDTKLSEFFSNVIPIQEDRYFLLRYLTDALCKNLSDYLIILVGGGGNKMILIKLLEKVFGEYFASIGGRNFANWPSDMNVKSARLLSTTPKKMIMSSYKSKNPMNSLFMKFIARVNHNNFKSHSAVIVLCDVMPKIDNLTPGINKTVRVINLSEKHNEINNYCDDEINRLLDVWKSDLISLLINYCCKKNKTKNDEFKNINF